MPRNLREISRRLGLSSIIGISKKQTFLEFV